MSVLGVHGYAIKEKGKEKEKSSGVSRGWAGRREAQRGAYSSTSWVKGDRIIILLLEKDG